METCIVVLYDVELWQYITNERTRERRHKMKTITRTGKYLHAIAEGRKDGTELVRTWALCSKPRKRYARHLVEVYGWDVRGATATTTNPK